MFFHLRSKKILNEDHSITARTIYTAPNKITLGGDDFFTILHQLFGIPLDQTTNHSIYTENVEKAELYVLRKDENALLKQEDELFSSLSPSNVK